MKQFLVVIILFFAVAVARRNRPIPVDERDDVNFIRNYLLQSNRIPKRPAIPEEEKAPVRPVGGFDICSECKDILQKFNALMNDESKIQQLKFMLNFACDMISSEETRDECKNMVTNIDALVHKLRPFLQDHQQFCTEIHMCQNNQNGGLMKAFLLLIKKQIYQMVEPNMANDATCDGCKFAVDEAKSYWNHQSVQDEVKKGLDGLCGHLGQFKNTCDNLIDAYFPLIIMNIDKMLSNSAGFCAEFGLCKSNVPMIQERRSARRQSNSEMMQLMNRMEQFRFGSGDSVGCNVCIYSFEAILDTLKNDQQLLQSWADGIQNICKALPTELQPGCNDFLSIYLEPVLRVTIDTISAREICDLLHACQNKKSVKSGISLPKLQLGGMNNAIICESCRLLAEFLKSQIGQKSFQDGVTEDIRSICDLVPGAYADMCDNLVNTYVPQVLSFIDAKLDPDTACPAIRMCPSRDRPKLAKRSHLF